jgi:hypothetical protein
MERPTTQKESEQHSEVRTSDKTKGQRGRMPLACAFTTPAIPTHISFGFSFSSSLPLGSILPFSFPLPPPFSYTSSLAFPSPDDG